MCNGIKSKKSFCIESLTSSKQHFFPGNVHNFVKVYSSKLHKFVNVGDVLVLCFYEYCQLSDTIFRFS